MGKLSVIGTPIGNLEDITLRALRVLREADVIACEDTRVTKKLLTHYDIKTPTISYHAHSSHERHDEIFNLLKDGKKVALVTDAGTPGISDPGAKLVSEIRERNDADIKIEAVPGPSALTAAISVAGLGTSEFLFLGFLPHKKGRSTLIKSLIAEERAVVLYESSHRIIKLLGELKEYISDRKIMVMREATKMFEEQIVGHPADVLANFESKKDTVRGEFVVLVYPA